MASKSKYTDGRVVEPKGRTWVGYYRLPLKDGKRPRVGLHKDKDLDSLHRQLTFWYRAGGMEKALAEQQAPAVIPSVLTGAFLQEWFESKLAGWADTTRDTNTYNFTKHVKADTAFCNTAIGLVVFNTLCAFRNRISGSENTKRNVLRLIRPAFKEALKRELLGPKGNPFDLFDKDDMPKASESRVVAFKFEQMRKLIQHVTRPNADPLWRAIVLLGFDYGCEPQEFLAIQEGDINLEAGTINLQRVIVEAKKDGVTTVIVKNTMKATGRNREHPVSNRTLQAIKALVGPARPLGAHLLSPDGKPWSYDVFIKLWRKLLVEAGVDHLPPLAMRHTMATLMLSRGNSITAVSKRLGHKNPYTTLTHYAHAMPDDTARLGHASGAIFDELLGHDGTPEATTVREIGPKIGPNFLAEYQ